MAASRRVVIGADTHRDTNHLAVITDAGKPLADAEFPTSPTGYDDALRWAQSFGTVMSPDRAARRRQGKSDPLDAYAAARAALAGHGLVVPKDEHHRRAGAADRAAQRGQSPHRRDQPNSRPAGHRPGPSGANATAATAPLRWSRHWRDAGPPPTATRPPSRCRRSARRWPSAPISSSVKNRASPHNWMSLSHRSIPRYGPLTVSVRTPPPNCSSPPALTRTGCATRPPSPRCAEWLPSRHPRAKSPATDSCTASRWCACRPTSRRATTSRVNTETAAPKRRFCGCSNAPSPAKYSDC